MPFRGVIYPSNETSINDLLNQTNQIVDDIIPSQSNGNFTDNLLTTFSVCGVFKGLSMIIR